MNLIRYWKAWAIFSFARWMFVGRAVLRVDSADGTMHEGKLVGSRYQMCLDEYPVGITFEWRAQDGDLSFGRATKVTVDMLNWHSGRRSFYFVD